MFHVRAYQRDPDAYRKQYSSPLDAGIAFAVAVLQDANVKTFESCEGAAGHAFYQPTVRFTGSHFVATRAFEACVKAELPIDCISKIWPCVDKTMAGPYWQITFHHSGRVD
jgi:hypothetical protein